MNSKAIKVIHCFRSPVGGLFRHVRDLVNDQVKQGLQIGIICDSTTGGEHAVKTLEKLESSCSLGIHRLAMSRNLGFSDIQIFRKLAQIYDTTKPDIIHSHGGKGGAYGRLLTGKLNAKTIYTPHGGSLHYSLNSPAGIVYLSLEKLLKPFTDGLIFESQFSADTYSKKIGAFSCVHRVIHNGLKENEFAPVNNEKAEFDFVFVGELRKLKGLEVLLKAVLQLKTHHKTNLLIVGAGPDEDLFKQQAHKMGIDDLVTFLPPVFPATQGFSQARYIVIPSLAESFPYIVLEATAAKIPLLTTRVGGIAEIFGPYADNLIPANDPDALANAMQKMIKEPEETKKIAELLQIHVKSLFKTETMVNKTIEFYQQVLSQPK